MDHLGKYTKMIGAMSAIYQQKPRQTSYFVDHVKNVFEQLGASNEQIARLLLFSLFGVPRRTLGVMAYWIEHCSTKKANMSLTSHAGKFIRVLQRGDFDLIVTLRGEKSFDLTFFSTRDLVLRLPHTELTTFEVFCLISLLSRKYKNRTGRVGEPVWSFTRTDSDRNGVMTCIGFQHNDIMNDSDISKALRTMLVFIYMMSMHVGIEQGCPSEMEATDREMFLRLFFDACDKVLEDQTISEEMSRWQSVGVTPEEFERRLHKMQRHGKQLEKLGRIMERIERTRALTKPAAENQEDDNKTQLALTQPQEERALARLNASGVSGALVERAKNMGDAREVLRESERMQERAMTLRRQGYETMRDVRERATDGSETAKLDIVRASTNQFRQLTRNREHDEKVLKAAESFAGADEDSVLAREIERPKACVRTARDISDTDLRDSAAAMFETGTRGADGFGESEGLGSADAFEDREGVSDALAACDKNALINTSRAVSSSIKRLMQAAKG